MVLRNYFQDRQIKIDTAEGTITKSPTKGCPQGSVLGSIICDILFQPCLEVLNNMEHVEMVVGYEEVYHLPLVAPPDLRFSTV